MDEKLRAIVEAERRRNREAEVLRAERLRRARRVDLEVALEHVRSQHDDLQRTIDRAQADFDPADQMAWAAVGFMLHNLYNAIENYFLRIAKFFENQIEGSTWHRDLVNRMAHEIPSLRPALLDRASLDAFHELRSFRHTFRALHDRKLDPRRVRLATENAPPAMKALVEGHGRFVVALDEIAREL
jgi:hypothetical protein